MPGNYAYTPFIWPMLFSALFSAVLAVYAWRHRTGPGAAAFAVCELLLLLVAALLILVRLMFRAPGIYRHQALILFLGSLLPMLFENPGMVLIGLDAEHNRAVLLGGQETGALTLERVRTIVEGGGPS
jgi:hypothetical protein